MANRDCKNKFIRYDCVEKARQEIGNTYNYVHITGVSHIRDRQSNILYEAQCTLCKSGETFLVRLPFLKNGQTKSCGCLRHKLARDNRALRDREKALSVKKWFDVYKGWWVASDFCHTLKACAGEDYWTALDRVITTKQNPFKRGARIDNDLLFSELCATLVSITIAKDETKVVLACQTSSHQVVFEVEKTKVKLTSEAVGFTLKFCWLNGQLITETMTKQYTVFDNYWIACSFYNNIQALIGKNYWRVLLEAVRSGCNPLTNETLPSDTICDSFIGQVMDITSVTPNDVFKFVCLVDGQPISFTVPTNQVTLTGKELGEVFRFSWTDKQLVMEKVG